MSHTVKAAMEYGELSEEEAYFLLRYAGHLGYLPAIRRLNPDSWWKRARQWVITFGGWERAHLTQWDQGQPAFSRYLTHADGRRFRTSPTPVKLFGRLVIFRWGVQLRLRGGYLVWSHHGGGDGLMKLYWSPNATPWHKEARVFWQRTHRGKWAGND